MSLFSPLNTGGNAASSAPSTGSIFGTSAAAPTEPKKLSMFGALKEPAKPTFGNMFADAAVNLKANQAATSAPTAGGLFGTANTSTTTATSASTIPSLFTTPATPLNVSAPAAGSSFFGAAKPATVSSTNVPSSFAASQQQQQQQQAPQGSLFSMAGNQNVPNNLSQTQSGQSSAQAAYFESLLEKNRKRQRQNGGLSEMEDIPSLQLGLGDISKRVRQLGTTNYSTSLGSADTKAHYLLAASGVNPVKTLRELDAFNAQVGAQPVSAIDQEWEPDSHKYVLQLQSQTSLKMINEGIERANKRFNTFLQDHIEMNWAEQRRKIYEHFGLTPRNANQESENTGFATTDRGAFGRTRNNRTGKPELGKSVGSRSVLGQSTLQKSVIGSPAVGQGNIQAFSQSIAEKAQVMSLVPENRILREKEGRFAEKVQNLNESRLQESYYPLLREFLEVETAPGSDTPSELLLAYKALMEIVDEDGNTTFAPRKFKDDYLNDNPNAEGSVRCRQMILNGSRSVLERQFFDELVTTITRQTKEAQVGGVPTRLHKVKAYVRVRATRKDLIPDGITLQKIGGDYCWALLFYLLRCGFADEAATYVLDNRNAFNAIDRMFATYITQYSSSPDRRISPQFQNKINSEYIQRTRLAPDNQTDPYRLACYKIVGHCEINKKSFDVIPADVKDWMWLQFCLAREANRVEELATDVYNLADLQADIHEIGQKHFQRGSDLGVGYGTFFLLQILGGLFENAVDFLYKHNYVAAIHFAIALDFYGLLRVSEFNASDSDLLSHPTRGQPRIDFGRMIGYYTRDFRASNVVAAIDYLILIHLNADLEGEFGRSYSRLCHEALRELVLETREFATLLGDINASNGERIKGAIELRLPLIDLADQEDYLRTVTIQAARIADDNGRTTDAVLLYHLAEDYNSVITILNRALSDSIAMSDDDGLGDPQSVSKSHEPNNGANQPQSSLSLASIDDPFVLARHFIGLYNPNAMYYQRISQDNRDVCGILMRIQETKDMMLSGKWGPALQVCCLFV